MFWSLLFWYNCSIQCTGSRIAISPKFDNWNYYKHFMLNSFSIAYLTIICSKIMHSFFQTKKYILQKCSNFSGGKNSKLWWFFLSFSLVLLPNFLSLCVSVKREKCPIRHGKIHHYKCTLRIYQEKKVAIRKYHRGWNSGGGGMRRRAFLCAYMYFLKL